MYMERKSSRLCFHFRAKNFLLKVGSEHNTFLLFQVNGRPLKKEYVNARQQGINFLLKICFLKYN